MHVLDWVVASHRYPPARGLPSVCSAHPWVLRAALEHGRTLPQALPVLIESTSNQVNQEGGYTGLRPHEFVARVRDMAQEVGFPKERLILGGDHLGPLPWAHLPAEEAMQRAEALVAAYVRAGYTKIHLDCSMPLGDEDEVPVEVVAQRTARLAAVAEVARPAGMPIRYIVGSEVPPAGGAKAGEGPPPVTTPEAAAETWEALATAFRRADLHTAWERVLALVVQPGIEFGTHTVHVYQPGATLGLRAWATHIGLVFEAHSTDYQPRHALRALVDHRFAILKVGPGLTFAFREAVFALEALERELRLEPASRLREVLEQEMLADPRHWQRYYAGDAEIQRLARAYGYSDRIRYYWPRPRVQAALAQLFRNLEDRKVPPGLVRQYLPWALAGEAPRGLVTAAPRRWVLAHLRAVLADYAWAARLSLEGWEV